MSNGLIDRLLTALERWIARRERRLLARRLHAAELALQRYERVLTLTLDEPVGPPTAVEVVRRETFGAPGMRGARSLALAHQSRVMTFLSTLDAYGRADPAQHKMPNDILRITNR